MSARRVVMVVANPSVSTTLGGPVGFWASELVHPWYAFTEVGYEVVVASPDGGRVEVDALSHPDDPSGYSARDVLSRGFLATPSLAALLDDTPALATLDLGAADALVVCGGQSPMFTFRGHPALASAIAAAWERGRVVAALCHGTAALIDLRLPDGSVFIAGRTMTGFADVEEDAADAVVGRPVMPWRIEETARAQGANYVRGPLWGPFAVRDGRLITGQQQYSGRATAELVISALGT